MSHKQVCMDHKEFSLRDSQISTVLAFDPLLHASHKLPGVLMVQLSNCKATEGCGLHDSMIGEACLFEFTTQHKQC